MKKQPAPQNDTLQAAAQPDFFGKQKQQSFFGDQDAAAENSFFSNSIQAKLSVGEPGDPYEQEADAVADKVVQRLAQPGIGATTHAHTTSSVTPLVQTKCAACEEEEQVQKKEEGEDKRPGPTLENRLAASRGGGNALPPSVSRGMSEAMGANFGGVRVHTGSNAVQMSNELGARAFTHGNDIYFNEGAYDTGSNEGQHLLAHELTHTLQQGASTQSIQKQSTPPDHLTGLNEMLDRFDVPEEEVLTLLGQLLPAEVSTVLSTPSYKNRMAAALDVGQMVQAVTTLHPPLATQLEWVEAAAWFTSGISYSEIQGLITGADQPARDALKTDRWRNFFVSVCDNATMVTALNDLHFDLVTKLSWLEAEMNITSWELSYDATIQGWISTADQTTERDALKIDRWRSFFVSICDNSTMVTALNDLHFDLVTKLDWLEAEMIITSWELSYSTIQPWITTVLQPERDTLKITRWRDFFASVCDNTTIKTALDDLHFDFLTTIRWLLNEVAVFNVDFVWLCNAFKASNAFPAGEEVIACEIMTREIRDGLFDTSVDHQPSAWITRAHNQFLVGGAMAGLVGQTATWRGSGPGSGTTFEAWASAPTETARPPLGAATIINCWEMVLYAAHIAGVLPWSRIHSMYTPRPGWGAFLVNELSFGNRRPYNMSNPSATRPVLGDIVFFDGSSHIALATGTVNGLGETEIYSFWPPPNTPFNVADPQLATIDQVKRTTIEALNTYWVGEGYPAFVVEYATANW